MPKLDLHILEDGVMQLVFTGNFELQTLSTLRADAQNVASVVKKRCEEAGKVRGILDLSHCTSYHPEALVILGQFCADVQPYVERAATFGATGTVAFARDVVLSLSGWKSVQSFDTEEEALSFVRDQRPST